ncbi:MULTISPECIES: hypothetical protein [Microbacterium]|uniref:hypothetical protein n=1 Tax=Microbacterium TaxID=33882 RepID=UPI0007688D39|nr:MULTISPECIES: hypothetical protein [Microbacterium]KXC06153.1 hypothetical protein MhomT_06795 [Microbacterium hominis]QYF97689.1 hypothetical protein KY498_16425 [Microbacterium sp. PAMC21962]
MHTRRRTKIIGILFVVAASASIILFVAMPDSVLQQALAAAATVFAAVAIWFQIKAEKDVAIGEFIMNLNNSFNDNASIGRVYGRLVREKRLADRDQYDAMVYLTFFETCYLLHARRVVDIALLDDLFGYRFFVAMHNPDIQRIELIPDRYSYRNLITLYDIWRDHVRAQGRWDEYASSTELEAALGAEYGELLHSAAGRRKGARRGSAA